jgi:hypothetical protein
MDKGDFDYEQEAKDLSFGGDNFICRAGAIPAVLGIGRAANKSLAPPLVYPEQFKGLRD